MTSRQLRPTTLLASRAFSPTVTATITSSSSLSSSGASGDVVVATMETKRASILSFSGAKSVFAHNTSMETVTTRSDSRDVQAVKTNRRSWPTWFPSWLNGKRLVKIVAVKSSTTTSYNNNVTATITTTATTPTSTSNGMTMGMANQALHAGYPDLTMFSTDAYNAVPNAVNTATIPVVSATCSLGSPVSTGKASPIVLVASSNPNYPPTTKHTMDLSRLDDEAYFRGQVHMLVNSLLPDWHDVDEPDALEITRLSGALTNRVYEVRFRDPNDTKHASRRVLLRVYGNGVDKLFSRTKELDWLRKLSAEGLGPRLLAVFGNGRLEEYFRSVTLTHDDLRDPTTCQKIARCMAQLHKLALTYPPPDGSQGDWPVVTRQWLPLVHRAVENMSDASIQRLQEMLNTDKSPIDMLQQLEQEIVYYEMSAIRANSPIVLGHNDLQYGNILRLRDNPDFLVLIDFEYAGYNPRGYDIANHFCEWMADYHGPTPYHLNSSDFPSEEERNVFLRAYLTESLNRTPTDGEVDNLWREVEQFIPCSHLVWSLWGLLQVDRDDIDFDYLAYGAQRLCMSRQYAQQLGFW